MSLSKGANGPLSPEERNVLEHLLRRAHLASNAPGEEEPCPSVMSADSDWSVPCGTSMTDAAKRRFDVSPEREARQMKYTGTGLMSPPAPPLVSKGLVGSTKRGTSIFLPEGIDDMAMWGRSILEFGKYESVDGHTLRWLNRPRKRSFPMSSGAKLKQILPMAFFVISPITCWPVSTVLISRTWSSLGPIMCVSCDDARSEIGNFDQS